MQKPFVERTECAAREQPLCNSTAAISCHKTSDRGAYSVREGRHHSGGILPHAVRYSPHIMD